MDPNARLKVPRDKNQDFLKWIKSFPESDRKGRLVKIVSGGVLKGTSAKKALKRLQQGTSVPLARLNFTQGLINQAQEYREEARVGVPVVQAQPPLPVQRPEKPAEAVLPQSSRNAERAQVSSKVGDVGSPVQKPCPLSRKRISSSGTGDENDAKRKKVLSDDVATQKGERKTENSKQSVEVLTVVEISEPAKPEEPEVVNLASPEDPTPQEDQPVSKEDVPLVPSVPSISKEAQPVSIEAPASKETPSKSSLDDLAPQDSPGATTKNLEGNAIVLPPSPRKAPVQSIHPEGSSSTPKSVAATSDRLVTTSRQPPAPPVNASNVPKTAKIMVPLSEHIVSSMMQDMATAIYDTEKELLKLNERLSLLEREVPSLRHEKVLHALRETCEVLQMKSCRIKNCVEKGIVDQLQRKFYPTLLQEIQRDARLRLYTSMRLVTIVNMLLSVARPNTDIKNVLNAYISSIIVEQNQRKTTSVTLDSQKEPTVANDKLPQPAQEARTAPPPAQTYPRVPVPEFARAKPAHAEPVRRDVSSQPNRVPPSHSNVAASSQLPAAVFSRSTAQPPIAKTQQVPPLSTQGSVLLTRTHPVASQPLTNYLPPSQVASSAQASGGAMNLPHGWPYAGSALNQPLNNTSRAPSSAARNVPQVPVTVHHYSNSYAPALPAGQNLQPENYMPQGGGQVRPHQFLPQNFAQAQAYMGQSQSPSSQQYSMSVVSQQIHLGYQSTGPPLFGVQQPLPGPYLPVQNPQVAVQQSQQMLALQAQQARNNQQTQACSSLQVPRQATITQASQVSRSHLHYNLGLPGHRPDTDQPRQAQQPLNTGILVPQIHTELFAPTQAQPQHYDTAYQSNAGSLTHYQQSAVNPLSRQPAKVARQYSASGGMAPQLPSSSTQAPTQHHPSNNASFTFPNIETAYSFLGAKTGNPEGQSSYEQSSNVKINTQVSPVARTCSRDSGISTPEPPQIYDDTSRLWPRRPS